MKLPFHYKFRIINSIQFLAASFRASFHTVEADRKIVATYVSFVPLPLMYTRSRITRTRLNQIIASFEGHLPHQKSLH